MKDVLSRQGWIALLAAGGAVIGVGAVVAALWAAVGNSQISAGGWAAMILGAVATLALGIGLMALVFISNRRGYDDPARRR